MTEAEKWQKVFDIVEAGGKIYLNPVDHVKMIDQAIMRGLADACALMISHPYVQPGTLIAAKVEDLMPVYMPTISA